MDKVFWYNILICAVPAYILGLLTAWAIYLLSGIFGV